MKTSTKKGLSRALLITQIAIYAFIILHATLWYGFHVHILTKLCPFVFADQVGSFELNFAMIFWVLVFTATLFLGRAFCAWGCMFGAFQDFVARIAKRLRIKPIKNKIGIWLLRFIVTLLTIGFVLTNKNVWPTFYWFTAASGLIALFLWRGMEKDSSVKNLHTLPKYILLVQYLGGIIALWITLNVFQKGITFVFEKYGVLAGESWIAQLGLAALVAFGIAFVEKRFFCKYLCPIGMVLRLISAIPFPHKYKVRAANQSCNQCGRCNRECMMGIKPMEDINLHGVVKDPNCINCLACVAKCPNNVLDFTTEQQTVENRKGMNEEWKTSVNK